MKPFFLLMVLVSLVQAEFEFKGHIDTNTQFYTQKPEGKNANSFTLRQRVELKYTKDDYLIFANLYAQEAYSDLFTQEDTQRSFASLDELYLKYDFENDSLKIGKSIEFWGALEVRNLTDTFNETESRFDMLEVQKQGAWNLNYSHYTQNGELSFVVKIKQEKQELPTTPYVYAPFVAFISYNGELKHEKEEFRPSIYLKYTATADTDYAFDYAFVYENGYDSQRYFSTKTPQNLAPSSPTFGQATHFVQNAYLVDKFSTYNTLVLEGTLIKLEALYAKVQENKVVGDYSHIGLGLEHTLENIYKSASFGFIGEYYKYDTYDKNKLDDKQLFESMQNDLFLGLRYSFNDANNASLLGGVIIDLEYKESVYFLKYTSRIFEHFKLGIDYYNIVPSTTEATPYAILGKHQRVALNIAYHF